MKQNQDTLRVHHVNIKELNPAPYNPRRWSESAIEQLKESIRRFGVVDPLLVNNAKGRENVVIGGHFRLKVAKELGFTELPVVYVTIPELEREKELNLRLNKNLGEWDTDLLKEFDEAILSDTGFTSEELDEIFLEESAEKPWDLKKALEKSGVDGVKAKVGDLYQLGDSRLMVGDSTNPEHFALLMGSEKADLCLTDPPYILDYLHAKRHGKPTDGFGAKRNRRYIGTDELPKNFTELWMKNIADHAKEDFSIICYENWKNLRIIWEEMERYWKIKNMIVWHLPNRHQNFASKYKFFSKHDIAMVGASGNVPFNHDDEVGNLQEMYETALYAISGKPQWESYKKGKDKMFMPTDFIEYNAEDEKNSGQSVVFGTKPLEILIPYSKVLTTRGDLVVEPFCGSGSTLIASTKLGRRCFIMEKQPIYAEVALARWEKETGLKRVKINESTKPEEITAAKRAGK